MRYTPAIKQEIVNELMSCEEEATPVIERIEREHGISPEELDEMIQRKGRLRALQARTNKRKPLAVITCAVCGEHMSYKLLMDGICHKCFKTT